MKNTNVDGKKNLVKVAVALDKKSVRKAKALIALYLLKDLELFSEPYQIRRVTFVL